MYLQWPWILIKFIANLLFVFLFLLFEDPRCIHRVWLTIFISPHLHAKGFHVYSSFSPFTGCNCLCFLTDFPDDRHITGLTQCLVFHKHHCSEHLHMCLLMAWSQLVRSLFLGADFLGYEICIHLMTLHAAPFFPECCSNYGSL